MSDTRHPALPYVAFTALSLIWGGSFLFIKLGIQDMSPTVLVLVRSASGAIALASIMAGMRRSLFSDDWRQRLIPLAIMAVINAVLPWALIAWGEQHITSGLASILNSTTALWTAILIFWVIPTERPSLLNYIGVLMGIAGVGILVLPDLLTHGVSGSVLGVIAVVLAAVSYAVAALFQRTKLRGMNIYHQSFGQLAATSVIALPLALPALPSVHLAWLSMGAVVFLGVGGSGIAYVLYYYTMNTLGPVRATGVTFVVPLTAVFWGVALLGESLTVPIVAGMVVILAGVVLTNVRRTPRRVPALERDSAAA
ncbi:MAG TPA: DMT family transporter [Candidatus Dormibacteraeota bacterium]|nr:DMT family transporter [Candidatus Dormibacteraeota bacterium]